MEKIAFRWVHKKIKYLSRNQQEEHKRKLGYIPSKIRNTNIVNMFIAISTRQVHSKVHMGNINVQQ